MIKRIFKYEILAADSFVLEMPKGAELLTVQERYGKPQLWALVDPDAKKESRYFLLRGTGHPIRYAPGTDYKYINSFQLHEGALVFHLFEDLRGKI